MAAEYPADDDFWGVDPVTMPQAAVAPVATPYTGAVPAGFSQADVEDFLRRNPGDAHRVSEALVRGGPDPGQVAAGAAAMPSAGGAPQSIRPYDQTFSFDQSKVGSSDAFKFRFDKAMQAIQRSGAAKGTLLSPQTLQAMQENASGLAAQETDAEYARQADTFDRNFGVYGWGETNRFNSLRTNRVDDWGFADADRRFNRGVLESDRAFDYGKSRDTMGDYWRFVDYGYNSARNPQ